MSRVTVTTVSLIDPQANHRKFYRTYCIDKIAVFQWGRIGTAGQFSAARYNSAIAAKLGADTKITEKMSNGYGDKDVRTFEFDRAIDPDDRETLKALGSAYAGSTPAPAAPPPAPDPTPAPRPTPAPIVPAVVGAHEVFTQRALDAVILAATDSQAAMVELALLREQWAELERVHEKAASYLRTLDTMLLKGVPA